jgi:hypothetical protein
VIILKKKSACFELRREVSLYLVDVNFKCLSLKLLLVTGTSITYIFLHKWIEWNSDSKRNVPTYIARDKSGSLKRKGESCPLAVYLTPKIRALWDVAPCNPIGVNRRFRGAYCFNLQGDEFTALKIEAVRTTETSLYSNQTTRRYMPEGSNFHTRRRESLKYHILDSDV